MAKSGSTETVGPSAVARATELKRELRRLAKEIAEEEKCPVEAFDQAAKTLSDLKDLRFRSQQKIEPAYVPVHFLCPISAELMRDPVIVATGQTYERRFIQKWLDDGNRTCPQTKQVLSHLILTPNILVRNMISQWCEKHGVEAPKSTQDSYEEGITQGERAKLDSLLEKISVPSVKEQKQAAKELRSLTKRVRSFRALIGETPEAVPKLVTLLSRCNLNSEHEIREDIVTTILNLTIHDSNKRIVAETPNAIPLLINALENGRMETRSNAAAALFSLSALDCNKTLIGELGALGPLFDLLEQGNTIAKKDAASAIFNLCIVNENRARAVKEGAVGVILKTIKEDLLVDELLAILAMLASNEEALEEMGRCGAVALLLGIIRESTSGRNRENSAAILYSICMNDRTKLREVKEEEYANRTLSRLAQNGTSRAQRKATSILERVRRITYTA
ncbi:hypothetical protein H6P81_014063 [Aristolochia fimbriata]|uniref:RING-type E3 ubiquitin transferase n=1 Tax=Aristolochia fimbriata TaxID=158543 RepID=A0AAV7EGG5_ARIFI|nr:hypothetical protein H6P81_014063 [Aristolochia fimbriata]